METTLQPAVSAQRDDVLASLYTLNKKWISDINFLEDEMKFMADLLDKFFTKLVKDEHVNRIQLIQMQLVSLGYVRKNIKKDIQKHQANIEETINNPLAKSDAFLELEDERMSEELADLYKSFKRLKKEIFDITRTLLRQDKEALK
jgi:hypothetical protein